MKTSAWSLRQITQSIRIGLMRSEKCRKLSFSLNEKRRSNLRFKNSKMNRRRSSRTSRLSRKIAWRIRLWISRSDLQPWKSKRIVNDAFKMSRDTTMTAWTTKTLAWLEGGRSDADGETWNGVDQEVAEYAGCAEGRLLGAGARTQGTFCYDGTLQCQKTPSQWANVIQCKNDRQTDWSWWRYIFGADLARSRFNT